MILAVLPKIIAVLPCIPHKVTDLGIFSRMTEISAINPRRYSNVSGKGHHLTPIG